MGEETPLEWIFGARLPWSGVWLNRHYLCRELAAREHVTYVLDPLPSRPSRRARRRAHDRDERVGEDAAPAGVSAVRLPDLPLQRFPAMARANRASGERRVRDVLRGDAEAVVVQFPRARLFTPGALGEALTVYYCSDDFRLMEDGRRDDAFCAWEDEMLARADLVIGVSPALCEDLATRHRRVRLVENGVDPALFRSVPDAAPEGLEDVPRPRVGFVGSVRSPLIDLERTAALAARRPEWSFVFVGWYDDDDPGIVALRRLRNVHVLGPRPREELASVLSSMDVLTCPYPPCEVTAVASPLKVFEAIAVGVPMVALHAPTMEGLRPHVVNTDSVEAYEAALREVLLVPPPPDPALVDAVSWAARTRTFRAHVIEALERSPSGAGQS